MAPHAQPAPGSPVRVRQIPTPDLAPAEIRAIRAVLDRAFADDEDGPMTDEDWQHALGGLHVLAERDGVLVGHAAVVPRELHVGGRPLRAGYVEAVGVDPAWQGQGVGTLVMAAVGDHVAATYEVGALATGKHHFYERLGWRTWRGPASVRTPTGSEATPDEDGFILILPTPSMPWDAPPLDAPISCEWRPGDVW